MVRAKVDSARSYIKCMKGLLDRVDCQSIEAYATLLYDAWQHDRAVWVFGNGGSASCASHHVADYVKTAAVPSKRRLRAFSLGDNKEILTAIGNDVDYDDIFRYLLEAYARPGDLAVAISCSGNSPNVLRACEWAQANAVTVVALTGFRGGGLRDLADLHINIPCDNYGMIEDVHLSIGHMVTQMLRTRVAIEVPFTSCEVLPAARAAILPPLGAGGVRQQTSTGSTSNRGGACENGNAKVLVLAGGLGTRLRPLTDRMPKCLLEIAGRPLLDYWFDRFAEANLEEVLINTHHGPGEMRKYIDQVNELGRFRLQEAFEPELLGSAGTIHANRGFADDADDVVIVYADNLSDVDLKDLIRFHRSHEDPLTMMLFRTSQPELCGIAQMDKEQRIVSFAEKPEQPNGNLANAGVYVVTANAYREIADMNAFDLGYDVLLKFVGRMRGWEWEGYHCDVGTPESLVHARKDAPGIFRSRRRVTL